MRLFALALVTALAANVAAAEDLVARPPAAPEKKDPAFRGACIYRVATPEEARALAEQDPAVQAGRLRVEVLTWSVGKGYVAFPKAPPVAEPAGPRPSPAP